MVDRKSLASVLQRDRLIILAGLVGVSVIAWAYTFYQAGDMQNVSMGMEMTMPQMQSWNLLNLALTFIMWIVMMVAMMVPSAAPMILMFATINRKRREQQRPFVPTGVFLLGYLLIWTGFSALATLAQWGLHMNALLSPMMVSTSPVLGGTILLVAGIYQWTSLKHICLTHCRSPIGFLMTNWREGVQGALVMGLRHGSYCLGCCWVLMSLLFVAGVMNLLWVAILTIFVLMEKIAPWGNGLSRFSGLLLVGWGAWMVVGTMV